MKEVKGERQTQELDKSQEILLTCGKTTVGVLPEGAIITHFKVGEKDVLFRDQYVTTEKGPKRRGGSPLLYPQAGPLTQESGPIKLPQHGFARNMVWEIDNDTVEETVRLKLASNDTTRKQYPHEFDLTYTVTVSEGVLRAELNIKNPLELELEKEQENNDYLPIAPGFHPYFHVPSEQKQLIDTNIDGFNPNEYDWKTPEAFTTPKPHIIITSPQGQIVMRASEELDTTMVWSEPGKDYVCFEPWTGEVNALLDPEQRLEIAPGESKTLFIELAYQQIA